YRLMLGGKRLLLKENPERFAPILEVLPQARQDLPHRLRQHQMCEALLLMQKAGIPIFHDEKATLVHPQADTSALQSELVLPAYYTSLEIKAVGPDGSKIKNARFYGVLLAESIVYLVYNAGESLMRWEQKSEIKTHALIQFLVCRELLPQQYGQAEIRAILIGSDMETARRILCEPHATSARIFRLDQTFEHFHFVPTHPRAISCCSCCAAEICSECFGKRFWTGCSLQTLAHQSKMMAMERTVSPFFFRLTETFSVFQTL
ncbi:MAG: hypothetical protein RR685_07605, partial [Hungatella sp.]